MPSSMKCPPALVTWPHRYSKVDTLTLSSRLWTFIESRRTRARPPWLLNSTLSVRASGGIGRAASMKWNPGGAILLSATDPAFSCHDSVTARMSSCSSASVRHSVPALLLTERALMQPIWKQLMSSYLKRRRDSKCWACLRWRQAATAVGRTVSCARAWVAWDHVYSAHAADEVVKLISVAQLALAWPTRYKVQLRDPRCTTE